MDEREQPEKQGQKVKHRQGDMQIRKCRFRVKQQRQNEQGKENAATKTLLAMQRDPGGMVRCRVEKSLLGLSRAAGLARFPDCAAHGLRGCHGKVVEKTRTLIQHVFQRRHPRQFRYDQQRRCAVQRCQPQEPWLGELSVQSVQVRHTIRIDFREKRQPQESGEGTEIGIRRDETACQQFVLQSRAIFQSPLFECLDIGPAQSQRREKAGLSGLVLFGNG
ncbi:hypothetical protein L901_07010 [Agrobacterium sp. D14]|nr:hypothetical protein L901_07010 [Agrobacterium sp. D14]